MKVTVSNMTNKPLNISKLAPLMPIQVLGVKQEIKVNVRDIDAVIEKAKEIGVTVTPIDEALKVTEITEPDLNIGDTTKPEDIEDIEDINPIVEDNTETNEDKPESVKSDKKDRDISVKSKRVRKSTKSKASVLKSIIGNNK